MNYNLEMEKIIEENKKKGKVPSLLLHSCCAPCSSQAIFLLTPYFSITVLYYNPNIEPKEEYVKRKEEEIRFIEEFPNKEALTILDCDYDNDKFHEISKGLELLPEGGERCFKCYRLRMEYTAQVAKKLDFDYFATTLTLSPLKNSQVLNTIGEELQEKYSMPYLYSDFKKKDGYKKSIELSKEYHLYRQDYCGCIYSKRDRELKKENQ